MPDGLVMPDIYLLTLAKDAGSIVDLESLIKFLKPWYGVEKHHVEIFACLQSTPDVDASSFRLDRKAALKAAKASKK